ncbi:unnamed protein product [Cylicocyclus nassatus]|uniref:Uncharacterized protein n=1 Tax=Cylicocyclus nassatus TaxID=53992 RepID=A0AA36GJA9_CYLNA|nr:unnamed protein product [Cylicocyclus nassatus]
MRQQYSRLKAKYSGSAAKTAEPMLRQISFLQNDAVPRESIRISNLKSDSDHELESSSVVSESMNQHSQKSSIAMAPSGGSLRKKRKLSGDGDFFRAALDDLPKAVAEERLQLIFKVLTADIENNSVTAEKLLAVAEKLMITMQWDLMDASEKLLNVVKKVEVLSQGVRIRGRAVVVVEFAGRFREVIGRDNKTFNESGGIRGRTAKLGYAGRFVEVVGRGKEMEIFQNA